MEKALGVIVATWRILRIVDDFPMTVTGKIQKFRMREIMERELAEAGP